MVNTEKKKILIAISSLSGGGAERVASVWAGQLADRGYDVSIFVINRSADEYPLSNKIKLYAEGQTRQENHAQSHIHRLKKIRGIVKTIAPDYIISFLFNARAWMMLSSIGLRAKRIDTLRVSPWACYSFYSLPQRFISQLSFNTARKIIVQASEQRLWFSKRNQKKCILIPNPISPIYRQCYREETSQEVVNFIAAGRIDPQKNYPMMIDAFAKVAKMHHNVRLQIFGAGATTYTQSLQDQIDSLGMQNHICLMGRSSHIEEEYKKNDVFLMSSDYEGLPNALMEAMASRLICISTDCKTGPRDLIENGVSGYMIPVGDNDALVNAIVKVINMPYKKRVEMAEAARHKIMTYCSEENSINKLCSLLK